MNVRFRAFVGRPIPGGWHYPIPGGPMVRAENYQDLIDKTTEYRVCNGLPVGDAKAEITAWYAIHFPFAVENCDDAEPKRLDELTEGVYAWINSMWKNPPHEFAEPDEITRRHAICLGCPWRAYPPVDTSKAGIEAQRRNFLLSRGGLGPDEVGWCRFHEHDNRLACMLPKEKISCEECPKTCWLKNNLTNSK